MMTILIGLAMTSDPRGIDLKTRPSLHSSSDMSHAALYLRHHANVNITPFAMVLSTL